MSIIGEHRSADTAAKLEEKILKAMNDPRWNHWLSKVNNFVEEELIEWYYEECADSYGMHSVNPEILKMFPRKNK